LHGGSIAKKPSSTARPRSVLTSRPTRYRDHPG
jgi:hypothetical protein